MRNQIQIPFPWFIVKDKRVSRFVLIPQKICFMIFSLPASKINLFSLPFHTFWSVFFLYLKPFSPLPFFPFFVLFFDISPLTYKRTLFRRQYTVCTKISQKFFLLKVFFFDMRLQKHWIGGYIADSDALLFGQTDNKKGARQMKWTPKFGQKIKLNCLAMSSVLYRTHSF